MADRYNEKSHKSESGIPGPLRIGPDIHKSKVEDEKTGRTEEGSGWSHDEAKRDAIKKLGGKG